MTKKIVSIILLFFVVSVDHIQYAYTLSDVPDYWTNQNTFGIVNVDDQTKAGIIKLVTNTFHKELIGKGVSPKFLNHTYLNVFNVKRIQNPTLFSKYNTRRNQILGNGVAPDVSSLTGSRGPVATTEILSSSMKNAIYTEANEHYLFHGTNINNINSIAENGFRIGNIANGALFGSGIYGAETSQKADRYADSTSEVFNMLLVRMTLGKIYSCTSNDDRNSIIDGSLPTYRYDSVMSNFDQATTSLGVFREYIVYREDQAYPEYIIEYTRSSSARNTVISLVHIIVAITFII